MCYTDADEELWQEDPYEYIRMKFGRDAIYFHFWECLLKIETAVPLKD